MKKIIFVCAFVFIVLFIPDNALACHNPGNQLHRDHYFSGEGTFDQFTTPPGSWGSRGAVGASGPLGGGLAGSYDYIFIEDLILGRYRVQTLAEYVNNPDEHMIVESSTGDMQTIWDLNDFGCPEGDSCWGQVEVDVCAPPPTTGSIQIRSYSEVWPAACSITVREVRVNRVGSGSCSLGPTPTPTPPLLYTISGNVFVDDNVNQLKNGAESNYTGGITITSTGGSVSYVPNPSSGAFTITGLAAGTYTISSNVPGGYQKTYPTSGLPSTQSFILAVGPSCNASNANPSPPNPLAGTCVAGNIVNANFGITGIRAAWFQAVGLDLRIDAGFFDDIPATALPNPYASLNGAGGTPGIIFSGGTTPTFGAGQASDPAFNWKVGTPSHPEIFTPNPSNVIKTSYGYISAFAARNGLTPVDISSVPHCFGGISNCKFNPALPGSGFLIANGDLVFTGQNPSGDPYTFPANRDFVILVDGDLIIEQKFSVPNTSTVTFAVKRDIIIDGNIGEAASTTTSDTPGFTSTIAGYFSADRNFIIRGTNDCNVAPDLRLNVGGAIITNASLSGGGLTNNRDLCADNLTYSSLYIKERPDFILNAPQLLLSSQTVWQEVAP